METKLIGIVASGRLTTELTVKSQKTGTLTSNADFSQFLTGGPLKSPPALGQRDLSDVSGSRKAPPALGQRDLADILGKRQP